MPPIWNNPNEMQVIAKATRIADFYGGEAEVGLYLINDFPGIGGTIGGSQGGYQSLSVALRTESYYTPGKGHVDFLKHLLIKKFEDFFHGIGAYEHAHIPRPLGSIDSGYIYEWAHGTEGFDWYITVMGGGTVPIKLDEWKEFVDNFNAVGIDMKVDTTDSDNANISKNIIHEHTKYRICTGEGDSLSGSWKRIDFGPRSIRINYDKVDEFLKENKEEITFVLDRERERYILMQLVCRYLEGNSLSEKEKEKIRELAYDFRLSSLSHLKKRGFGDVNI